MSELGGMRCIPTTRHETVINSIGTSSSLVWIWLWRDRPKPHTPQLPSGQLAQRQDTWRELIDHILSYLVSCVHCISNGNPCCSTPEIPQPGLAFLKAKEGEPGVVKLPSGLMYKARLQGVAERVRACML